MRNLKLFGLLLVAVMILAACTVPAAPAQPAAEEAAAPAEAAAGEGGEVTFWAIESFVPAANEAIIDRVAQFEEENGVTVNVELVPLDTLRPMWAAAIESGNVPDVSHQPFSDVGAFYKRGVLMDVTDLLAEIQANNEPMFDSLIKVVTFEDKQWAVPYYPSATVLFYRTDMFEQAGLTGPPETWDQFKEYAAALTNPAEGVYGAGVGLGPNYTDGEWWTRQVVWSYGGAYFTEDGTSSAIDSPEGRAAYEYMASLFQDGLTPPGSIGWDDSSNNQAYLTGQAAMIINVGSVYYALSTNPDNADLYENTGYALIPAGPGGRYVTGIANNLAIFKDAKNPELAKKLIAYLLDYDFQKQWMEVSGYQVIPVYPSLASDPYWDTEAGKVFTETPEYFEYLGYPGPFTPASGEVWNLRLGTNGLEQMLVENKTLDEAMQSMTESIDETISKSE